MKYSVFEYLYLVICKLYTMFFFQNARLIRLPIDIRNRKAILFGKNFTSGKYCRLETNRSEKEKKILNIGSNVQINDFVHISAWKSVSIGDDVLIASKVYISDVSHGDLSQYYDINLPPIRQPLFVDPVKIGDNVWIGENVSVLPGVTIGRNSIIGAGSIVTKNIPAYTIAVGIPAKAIKRYCLTTKKWRKIDSKGCFVD